MKNIIIKNRAEAESYDFNSNWAVISITDKRPANININNVLRLQFADAMGPSLAYPDLKLFEEFHAEQIFNFVKNLTCDFLMIHCEQGYCRSPAVGAVLDKCFLNGNTQKYFDKYNPNPLVFRIMWDFGVKLGYISKEDLDRIR